MTKDNEVDEKVMPVAWQWLDTSIFRKSIPSAAIREHWNPLYSAATVAELRAEVERLSGLLEDGGRRLIDENMRASAAERRVGELEANDRRYRFLRRKLCVTGNGDGTCAMQAINLPHRIHGWPEHGEHEQFFDAAIDSSLTGADPT